MSLGSTRLATVAIAFATLTSCKDRDEFAGQKPALPLDETLPSGVSRAGVITRPEELLQGITAKGRIGDFKIYNSKIAIVIGASGFARGYNPFGGTIVDADRVRPKGEPGQTTFGEVITALDLQVTNPEKIFVASDGTGGGPAIIRVEGVLADVPIFKSLLGQLLSRESKPIRVSIEYILAPDADALELKFTLHNYGDLDTDIGLAISGFLFGDGAAPFSPGFGFASAEPSARAEYYGAIAPKVSYVYGHAQDRLSHIITMSGLVLTSIGNGFTLRAREKRSISHLLLVGDGDLSRTQALWRKATGRETLSASSGRVLSMDGAPIAGARVHVTALDAPNPERNYVTMTRSAEDGTFQFEAAPGEYEVRVVTDAHVASEPLRRTIGAGGASDLEVRLPGPGRLSYRVSDDSGQLLPAKLLILPSDGNTGRLPSRYGEADQPGGTLRAEYAIHGEGSAELRAGTYTIIASRGVEYEISESEVTIEPGREARFTATLKRSVDTTGWQSTDTHVHSQLSPDSPDLFPFKVATMIVEGLEMPISTEHEAIGDFNPAIRELGLERWMQGVVGSEITTFVYGHFNAFPLQPDFTKPGNGRVEWVDKRPGETFATIRQNSAAPFIQVNHPRSTLAGGYFSAMGLDRTAFSAQKTEYSTDFDGIEVANGCGAGGIEENEMLDWFAFLNHGQRKVALGSTDNHRAGGGGMGYPRTYVRLPTDEPSAASIADFRRSLFEGRAIITCGPFIDLQIGDAEIGDTVPVDGESITVSLRAAAPSWMDLDQLEVIAGGVVVETVPVTSAVAGDRFEGTVTVPVERGRDSWVILRARGDRRHGIWGNGEPAWAFTNPIFLDGDRDGRWTMQ